MPTVEFKDVGTLVGQETGVSDWVQITQERVNTFAEATGDHQWIHVDVERATRDLGNKLREIAAEALETLDADISAEDLEDSEPFEEGDLGVLADIGLPDAVLGVILDETDLYADEQLGRIAREMGFAEELAAVLDRLDR